MITMKFDCFNIFSEWQRGLVSLIIFTSGVFVFAGRSNAQQTPLSSGYYQNMYILNPAFAGIGDGLNINVNYRNQWRVIPGSPVNSTISADYRFSKVGVGLKILSDKAGLITRNSVSGTYAYHLPLAAADQQLHFGLSLGLMKDRFESSGVIGDANDPRPAEFNARSVYIDGDFGLAYTISRFGVQASVPHLKTYLKKDVTNSVQYSTLFFAMSYVFGKTPEIFAVEPKLSYLASSGVDDIISLGANARVLNDQFSISALVHSSRSSSIGIGFKYDKYQLNGYYTTHTVAQNIGSGGSFEIHLKMNFLKKENVYTIGTSPF